MKSRAITGELRLEIVFLANAFAIPNALFIEAEQTKTRELRESAKDNPSCILSIRRHLDRITTEPAGDEDYRELAFRIMWLRDDRAQSFAVWHRDRIVDYIHIRV